MSKARNSADGHRPLVSVCIPAFEVEGLVGAAVASALNQTERDLEVVVVDNASKDETLARVREFDDGRVRAFRNSRNIGAFRNFNRAIALARGEYVKLLCADDTLAPECVESMLRPFRLDPAVGLCFSRREIVLEDPADPVAARWRSKHENAQSRFGPLVEVNDGSRMLDTWIESGLRDNWIGEPTSVMMSRECLVRTGSFPLRLHDRGDLDLWARAMLAHRVGYVDAPLVRYLVRAGSLAADNRRSYQPWLDSVWLLEDLLDTATAPGRRRQLKALRRRAISRAARNVARRNRIPARGKLRDARAYLAFRLRHGDSHASLYGDPGDTGQPGETVEVGLIAAEGRESDGGSRPESGVLSMPGSD